MRITSIVEGGYDLSHAFRCLPNCFEILQSPLKVRLVRQATQAGRSSGFVRASDLDRVKISPNQARRWRRLLDLGDQSDLRGLLKRGQKVRLNTPGGGGYGPPTDRAAEDRDEDRRLGYVTS